ncbi:hypothetical protein BST81_08735 [Leptolyngbya sp. 'hensonii']|uniref:hypothetical protein n=1 Tax=Leptolyngbya sp. 'hensonii' TaxID=1922337 RepID=UPI00094FE282|nr:hypothetical protein [Leptolyngbya sp. 'hensonii']OLP18812.1 hypothetical protein BST81_08735 [Leptolyngbya sp. 'hensonii']
MAEVSSHDLRTLSLVLQEHLQSVLTHSEPIQIQCVVRQDILMVLGQHSAAMVPDPQQTLQVLEHELRSLQPVFNNGSSQMVRLYLRVLGQPQPYMFHEFTIEPQAAVLSVSDQEMKILTEDFPIPEENALESHLEPLIGISPETESPGDEAGALTYPLEDPLHLAEPVLAQPMVQPDLPPRRRSPLWLIAGGGLGIMGLLGGMYMLTRPCVIGTCEAIQTAQTLNQEAAQQVQQARSEQDVIQARKKLEVALENLAAIPSWSNQRSNAQALSQTYQAEVEVLDRVIAAQKQAMTAAQKSANPPHPLQDWLEIEGLWKAAIAELVQVPKEHPAYALAQRKQVEYSANLAVVQKRIQAERQSQENLKQGRATARVAETLQGIAQNLESWRQVQSTWQIAVASLQKIPQGTAAYSEAQAFLKDYQAQLLKARNHATSEQLAEKAYKQAVKLAGDAKSFEQKGQWSLAVASWREAVNQTQQVPADTFYANEAQPLTQQYTESLTAAEENLRQVALIQKTRVDLSRTCSGPIQICDYTVTANLIKVKLTVAYMRALMRTGITAQSKGDVNAQIRVNEHLQTLQAALEAISENSGIPIEIYSANDSLMGRYIP